MAQTLAICYGKTQKSDWNAVQQNLRAILGEDTQATQLSSLTAQVYANFGKYLVDVFSLEKMNRSFIQRRVLLHGIEMVDAALRQKRGVILLTAHLGTWELGAAVISGLGYHLDAVVLQHRNVSVNRFFVRQRLKKGVRSIPIQYALRESLVSLKQNHLVAIVGDRDYTNQGIQVNFLGRTVKLPKGMAYLALKSGAPVIPSFVVRELDGRIRILLEQPLAVENLNMSDENIQVLTQKGARAMEKQIRIYPTQWFVFRPFWDPIVQ